MQSAEERESLVSRSVDIFVVNFAGAEVLTRCIESIVMSEGVQVRLTIINNDAGDPSVKQTTDLYPHVNVITPKTNIGYEGGIGLAAMQSTAEHLIICNNDLVFEPDAISRMLASMDEHDADCVSARIVNPAEKPIEADFNASLNPYFFLVHGIFVDRSQAVYPSGACFLIKREALKRCLFPPGLFMYYEDVLLGMALRMKGYKIVQANDAVVHHRHGHAVGGMSKFKLTFYRERNRQACVRAFFDRNTRLKLSLAWPVIALYRAFTAPGRGASFGGTLTAGIHAALSPKYIGNLRDVFGVKAGSGEKICAEMFTSNLLPYDHPKAKKVNAFSKKLFASLGINTRDSE